jgi:hypothetical protein
MLKDRQGKKATPKQFAARVFATDLELVYGYWYERWESEYGAMTPRELKEVERHMNQFADRMMKVIGYRINDSGAG